jgi:hypothetical protein
MRCVRRPEGALREPRRSGIHDLGGGAACFAIVGAAKTHQSRRVLHLDGCGLTKLEMGSLVDICQVAVVSAMPPTVAELYATRADAMLARGGVTRARAA